MEFLILGPVEARDERRAVRLGGSKQRALLAILLLRAGEVVSTDRLIQGLWGEDPPSTAPKMVQVFVSRLRSSLEEGGAQRVLFTQPPGYVLHIEPDQLDVARFESLAASARAVIDSDPGTASSTLRQALDLWHGAPLADVALEPFAAAAIVRLDELHLSALEDRVDADLALGRQADLVAELRDLVGSNPLRERLRGQLMLALYRSGRQAEALEVYRDGRAALADVLGIDPGPELQRLETAILRQDPRSSRLRSLSLPLRAEAKEQWSKTRGRRARPGPGSAGGGRRRRGARPPRGGAHRPRRAPGTRNDDHARGQFGRGRECASSGIVADVPVGSEPASSPPPVARSGWEPDGPNRHPDRRAVARPDQDVRPRGRAVSVDASDNHVWIGDGYTGRLYQIIAAYDQLSSPFYPGPVVPGQVATASPSGDLWVGLADGGLVNAASNVTNTGELSLGTGELRIAGDFRSGPSSILR
jgi:DNA-binding SARP family transcriptional activator